MQTTRTFLLGSSFLTAALVLLASGLQAQDAVWMRPPEQGVGDWNSGDNWGLGVPPTQSNTVRINNGGTVLVNEESVGLRLLYGTLVDSSAFMEIVDGGSLFVDGNTNQFGAGLGSNVLVTMTGGSFEYDFTGPTDIARFGSALLDMDGGEFTVGGTLRLGVFERDGQGTIEQSGGTINVGNNLSIMHGAGNADALTRDPFGKIFQTGGTLNVAGTTFLGLPSAPRGMALYEIGAATFNTEGLALSGSDHAMFRITDPTADITVRSHLGFASNAAFEAESGSTIKFTAPTGELVEDPVSPYFGENVYFTNSLDAANSSVVGGLGNTTLVFAGGSLGGANVGLFEVGGTDLGAVAAGFEDNFSLGGLSIGDGSDVGNLKLVDLVLNGAADETPQALYVDGLNVTTGSTLDLNGLNLYYRTGTLDGMIVGGNVTQLTAMPSLAGDYNDDGVVNTADYTVWRDNLGAAASLPNDPLGGTIGIAQYEQWKGSFGAMGMVAASAAPEPSTVCLVCMAVAAAGALRRRANY